MSRVTEIKSPLRSYSATEEVIAPLCLILQKVNSPIRETRIIDNKWTVDREMTNRSVLSDELANFCADYPIYYTKKLQDSMTSTRRIQTGGEKIVTF